MTIRRKHLVPGLTLIILAALCPASPARQVNNLPNLWLFKARQITDSLVKDADALGRNDRALLWARLGQAWWQEDSERARAWMQKAVEAVESVPNRESSAERAGRLNVARELLRIVAPRDLKLRARLLSVFADAPRADAAESNINAGALMQAALAMLKEDPRQAAELGAASLRAGYSAELTGLLWGLRAREPKLADALFVQALAAARSSYDVELLNSLRYVGFTDGLNSKSKIPEPPDALRVELLKVYLEYLRRSAEAGGDQTSVCVPAASFISPLLPYYERFLPQQAFAVREVTTRCQAALTSSMRQRADDALREKPLDKIEDLLEAADKTDNRDAATAYRFRAAQMAAGRRDLKRAVEILDRIDAESRKIMGGMWEKLRTEWTASLALEFLARDDVQGVYQIFGAAPPDLRPLAHILFSQKLSAEESRVSPEAFLAEARKELARLKLTGGERVAWHVRLVRLYTKHLPLYAPDVLKEAVAAINRVDKSGSAFDAARGPDAALSYDGAAELLPVSMLEDNDLLTLEIVGTIESPVSRSQARLSLLNASLDQYRKAASQKAAPLKKASNDTH